MRSCVPQGMGNRRRKRVQPWKGPAAPAAWPKADQSGKQQEQSFRLEERCPDRSLGTMGKAISLSAPNLPNNKGSQGGETDLDRPPRDLGSGERPLGDRPTDVVR